MLNPEICDKCWEYYYDRVNAPVDAGPTCRELYKSNLTGWYCPEEFSGPKNEQVGVNDHPPKKCPKLFEHAVAEGMKHA